MQENYTQIGFMFSPLLTLFILCSFFAVNGSPSLPHGIYIRSFSTMQTGSVVAFKHNGAMLIKYVAAIEGDYVHIDKSGYYVNGEKIGEIIRGQNHITINEYVPAGVLYVFAPHERSYDSRYFGAIPAKGIRLFAAFIPATR